MSEFTSWGRHLLFFTDREYYTADCFLELVTAMLRIMNPESLEMMQLCFSRANIQVYLEKT